MFTYLMGGLALAASAMNEGSAVYEGAGFSYRTGDAAALAAGLRRWMEHPTELQAAKDRAWELAGTRYNWEAEQHKLLAAVECVLAGGSSSGLGRA
ncbi:MAG: hypothetical protein EBS05_12415 [Proteobacteria bacterium]|nr:hypothetical protein [Pseudomonadota bacterium]